MRLAAIMLFGLGAVHAQQHENCWLSQNSGYSVKFYGANPSVADFQAEIRSLAVLYKVPVERIGAVCHQESVGAYQYDADGYSGPGHVGTGFVVHNISECEYCFTHGIINFSGSAQPPGLGLMQLTGGTATSTADVGRLITDWRFNLEAGVKVLASKYKVAAGDDPSWLEQMENDNMNVLENWFYGLRYYNGYKSQANYPTSYLAYIDSIYGKVASPTGRLSGLFAPVTITKPVSVIGGWADGNSFVALPMGEWRDKDNKAFSGIVHVSGGGTTTDKAEMTAPAAGMTLAGSTVTFQWSAGQGVSQYFLYVGNSQGANDLYGQSQGSSRLATVSGIPTDDRRIYVRIWSYISGAWQYSDTAYTAASSGGTTTAKAEMTAPAAGMTLAGSAVTFQWSAGQGVSQYFLYVGNFQGANDLYGQSQGTGRSAIVSGIPTDGRKIYVRIWSYISGTWQYSDTAYIAK
jgi:hypothetical protein